MTRSDALLTHFLSFSSTTSSYTLPASVQNGIPLFHLLPGTTSGKAAPAIGINTPDGKYVHASQHFTLIDAHHVSRPTLFHQFWRPLCTIDTSQWYRWFHSDKLVLILRPEFPLPKNLLQQSTSGRYGAPLCRPAASHLFEFLKGWSSAVLREGHSYMRFLPTSEHPRYFCFVRVAQKYPCMVLHIGYIEGTPRHIQSDALSMLIQSLEQLSPPTKERGGASANKKRSSVSKNKGVSVAGQPMVNIVEKQLQRVIIR